MRNGTKLLKILILKVAILMLIVHCGSDIYAQNYEWEIDKIRRRELEKKAESDSLMLHLKNNWQISMSYGQWFFENSAKSEEKSLLEFPINMGVWNFSLARYLSEYASVKVDFGILIKKIEPPRPSVISILGGADVSLEGGGIFLMPTGVGMDYFLIKQRFRPYAGFQFGVVPANYTYVEASGNLANGINKNEIKIKSIAPFAELSTGFIYRLGKNVQIGLDFDYLQSKEFSENIGGYKAYSGFKTSFLFSVVF